MVVLVVGASLPSHPFAHAQKIKTNKKQPPMCFSADDADFLVDVMDHALGKL